MDNWMYQPASADMSAASRSESINEEQREGSSPEAKHGSDALPSKIRRRNRPIASCLECRRRKLKCDKLAPCSNCTRFNRNCLYLASSSGAVSQKKLAEIKEKMGALERNLEREVAGEAAAKSQPGPRRASSLDDDYANDPVDDEPGLEEEDSLEPTTLSTIDNVYCSDADDDLVDLGVQLGKMRITERIGGWVRPNITGEISDALRGFAAHDQAAKELGKGDQAQPGNDPAWVQPVDKYGTRVGHGNTAQPSPRSYIGPGKDYIAPASSFFFPGTNMNTSLLDYLPSKKAADQLVEQYFRNVHCLCTAVHRPTFEAAYALFWDQIAKGTEPAASRQAVIFAAMFSAAVSADETTISNQFGTSKASLIDSLRSACEYALCKANLLRTSKFETIQAFVMYLIPQIRGEVSRAHSALVGTAIRLAECMGLHRDGLTYNMTPVEIQVRRLIWHQLVFLDMRTCEATGPRPQIRPDDYDTRLPWNVDDVDLIGTTSPPQDKECWTDTSFIRIRSEISELRRGIYFDNQQLDRKKKTLTSIMIKIQKMRATFAERFNPWIDESIPFQLLAKTILTMFSNGIFISVLHRYLLNIENPMPDRLRQILIEAGVVVLEKTVELDRDPKLQPWAWYRGALSQYHVALLLLAEIHRYPMRKEAPRIWKSLDYVFDVPSHLSPRQKGELVLMDLRDRMAVYHEMRKIRLASQSSERTKSPSVSISRPDGGVLQDDQRNLRVGAQGAFPNGDVQPFPGTYLTPSPRPSEFDSMSSTSGTTNPPLGNDVQMVEDIDWTEWNKYFPLESNTGDLNIPDFDFANFSGGLDGGFPPASGATGLESSIPSAQDLSDIHFTPTYIVGTNMRHPSTWSGT